MLETKEKRRDATFDIAKGIAILFVVIGHIAPTDSIYNQIAFSFHMPLFFIVAGFFISPYNYSFGEYVSKKATRLLLPFLVYCLLELWASCLNIPYVQQLIVAFVYSSGYVSFGSTLPILSVPWFLQCLFVADILFFLTVKIFSLVLNTFLRVSLVGLVSITLGVGGYYLGVVFEYNFLPYSIDLALFSQIYLFIGYLLSELRLYKKFSIALTLVSLPCIAVWVGGLIFADQVPFDFIISMNNRDINVYSFLYSIAGSISVLYLSKLLSYVIGVRNVFSYLSTISVVIYLFHLKNDFILFLPLYAMSWEIALLARVVMCVIVAEILRLIVPLNFIFGLKPYPFERKLWDKACGKKG